MVNINQKEVIIGFSDNECKYILKSVSFDMRVSKESVFALNKLITKRAREIAAKAVTLAEEMGKEEIGEEEITRAVRMTSAFLTFEVPQEASFVHYVWFISSGGTCLLSRSYSGLRFPDTIFAGLLTGILDLFGEVTGRKIDKFTMDDLTIHCRRIGEMTVAVMCDSEQSTPIDELAILLAKRFNQVFAEELDLEVIDTSIFEDFTPVLDALITGVGMNIPKDSLKVFKSSITLTEKQLQETVDATALRQEIKRAQEVIQEFEVFKTENEQVGTKEVERFLHEPPDVSEIKAVIRQASKNIREEFNNGIDLEKESLKKLEEREKEDLQKKHPKTITDKSRDDIAILKKKTKIPEKGRKARKRKGRPSKKKS